jgi:hypothetical protein
MDGAGWSFRELQQNPNSRIVLSQRVDRVLDGRLELRRYGVGEAKSDGSTLITRELLSRLQVFCKFPIYVLRNPRFTLTI